jgi:putative transcriptional regulator
MAILSKLKNEKIIAIRLSTLESICKALDCQPGDILEYKSDEDILG